MMQSNAIRNLEEILSEGVASGDRSHLCGAILLKAMKLDYMPNNMLDFYELLKKTKEDARRIKNIPKVDRYIRIIDELHQVFVLHHPWSTVWNVFAAHIESRNILNTLDSLANYFESQNPAMLLEQDFLDKLNSEFRDLLDGILKSDLSKDLKIFLIEQIENILRAISRYHIDGTEGLGKASKSFISDLVMSEHNLDNKDKNNPLFIRIKASFIGLLIWIAPTPYDIIGAVPDVHDFWKPQIERFFTARERVEQIICETSTTKEAFENVSKEASSIFGGQEQKSIVGADQKLLPASTNDKNNL
jgi:hypothetical protein